ncbi:hypothetical protein EBU24_02390, partial [bacterium]|nr:hypothetical protein [bacterium]
LFSSMTQITKTLRTVSIVTSGDMRGAVIGTVLERDISGSCIPFVKIIEEEDVAKKGQPKTSNNASNTTPDKSSGDQKEKKKENKTVPKAFVYEHDAQDNLLMFTFITVNPAAEYNTTKSRPIRVIYTLKEDKEQPGTFVFKRQETEDFMNADLIRQEGAHALRAVTVVSGVKKCSFEFTALEVIQEEKTTQKQAGEQAGKAVDANAQQTKKEKKIEKKITKVTVWDSNSEENQDQKSDKKRTLPLMPELVSISLVFAHSETTKKETVFESSYITLQAGETFTLEDIKPVSSQQEGSEKLEHLFDEDRLSEGLGGKLDEWTKKIGPTA